MAEGTPLGPQHQPRLLSGLLAHPLPSVLPASFHLTMKPCLCLLVLGIWIGVAVLGLEVCAAMPVCPPPQSFHYFIICSKELTRGQKEGKEFTVVRSG